MKERFTIQASALSSYLGCGYNSINRQFKIDMGQVDPEFTDEQRNRMNLGKCLESGVLDFFEKRFGLEITHRNDNIFTAFDGNVRCLCDGLCIYNGVETVVECKVSLSDSEITKNKGYHIQCQAYMEGLGYSQALLIGLQKGEPVGILIKRDEELIDDLRDVVDSVVSVLSGIETVDDYFNNVGPILMRYAPSEVEDTDKATGVELDIDESILERIVDLKAQEKELSDERKELEAQIKDGVDEAKYSSDHFTVSISTSSVSRGYDMDMLMLGHPEIDFEAYKKAPNKVKRMTIKKRG